MKAVKYYKYGPPDVLQIEEVPVPVIKEKDVLIKIKAATVTLGDCELRRPDIPYFVWFLARIFFGLFRPRKNILGAYLSGIIEKTGNSVHHFKAGDKVFGVTGPHFGGHAEYVAVDANAAFVKIPENLSFEEAAPIALGLDSLHFLRKAKVQPGEHVLINGAGGGIGTYAVQIAKHWGAEVTAIDSIDKLEMLKLEGADHTLDYENPDFQDKLQTYDVIFDVVGVFSHRLSLKLLKPRGRYISAIPQLDRIFIGFFSNLFSNKKSMTGLTDGNTKDLMELCELAEKGAIRTVLDGDYRLEDMVQVHHFVESGKKKGNTVVKINS